MFNNWIMQAREHWKEHQPTRFKELKSAGKLEAALKEAAERTHQEMSSLEAQGYRNHEAWEIVRERYLFPPQEAGLEEDEEPNPWRDLQREATQLQSDMMRLAHDYDPGDVDPPLSRHLSVPATSSSPMSTRSTSAGPRPRSDT